MPITELFTVSAEDLATPEQAAMTLNRILSRISDRLDQLQGLRGDAEVQGNLNILDAEGNVVAGFSRE